MNLSLQSVANHPDAATYTFNFDNEDNITIRPLESGDLSKLHDFLRGLSEETRRLSTFEGYDLTAATELCEAINKYDKLRFVVEAESRQTSDSRIVGLIEFSFDIPKSDIERYKTFGYDLNQSVDCRFGPTLADDYQSKGLGTKLFPYVVEIALRFGKQRIILWGGVLKDNKRAIHFYKKHGFKKVGEFTTEDEEKIDMILDINS